MNKLINPALIIGLATVARLLPHPPNFAPIAAMALFGGAYFDRKYALIIPLTALFIGDFFLGFYEPLVMISVYGSFLLIGLIGIWLNKRRSPLNIIIASISSSILFFLVTNTAVWLSGTLYPSGPAGWIESIVAGLPFLKNTLAGDLFYTISFFASYEIAKTLVSRKSVILEQDA